MFEYCSGHYEALSVTILLCLYSGIRFTEVCALRYSDIDFRNGAININKKVQRQADYNNEYAKTKFLTVELKEPEKRIVVLSKFISDYLKDYLIDVDDDCYILSKSFKLPEQRLYQMKLKALCDKYHLNISYTMLRNTCKEKCIRSNIDMNTLLNNLGLSRISIDIKDTEERNIAYKQKDMNKLIPVRDI
ncbi:MAG: tyrosine-type recombinase/integrase [Erysipelotrichaceae bacterium]|nr:tyrosine-type recombinase/integrase [Erysipelotrichaceae bacterium]